jgi:hypothetical protein
VVHCRAAAPFGRVGPAPQEIQSHACPNDPQMIRKTSGRHPKTTFEIKKKILLIF